MDLKDTSWLEIFRSQFPDESESMNILVQYEVLLIEIERMINEDGDDLPNKIKQLIMSFKENT